MKNNVELIVFDLDGTLFESSSTIYKTVKCAFEHLNINVDIPKKEMDKRIGMHFKPIFKELNIIVDDFDKFIDIYKKYYFDFIEDTIIYRGVIDTLDILKEKGFKLSVLTTKVQDQTEKIIEHFNMSFYFDVLMGRKDGVGIKPSAEPLLLICEELNISPVNTMIVGDSELDIRCGKNAGALTCCASYGHRDKEMLDNENPDYMIGNFEAIKEVLKLN
jgi:phosphoglycolate phosphatase-like HAD superfamily hydrolase